MDLAEEVKTKVFCPPVSFTEIFIRNFHMVYEKALGFLERFGFIK